MASPAACFAGAGRLIAPVVHHIQIVSEGFPLPTSRMHANPTGNIHIPVARIALDATQSCGHPLGLRASNEPTLVIVEIHINGGGCRMGHPVFDGTIAWLPARVTLVTPPSTVLSLPWRRNGETSRDG